MEDLQDASDEPFRGLKERLDTDLKGRFGIEEVMPWHLSDPFFQEPPERGNLDVDRYFAGKDLEALTRETYDRLGT
jgi:peptidyl-dipeptidase A